MCEVRLLDAGKKSAIYDSRHDIFVITLASEALFRAYWQASGARKGVKGKSGVKPARSRHCE